VQQFIVFGEEQRSVEVSLNRKNVSAQCLGQLGRPMLGLIQVSLRQRLDFVGVVGGEVVVSRWQRSGGLLLLLLLMLCCCWVDCWQLLWSVVGWRTCQSEIQTSSVTRASLQCNHWICISFRLNNCVFTYWGLVLYGRPIFFHFITLTARPF